MGLIRWIKKEIESTTSSRRRQSAPPRPPSPGSTDDAYLKAIAKFNQWRNLQRLEKLNESSSSSKTSPTASRPTRYSLVEPPNDFSLISDIEINDYEKNVLLMNAHKRMEEKVKRQSLDPSKVNKMQHSVVFYSNLVTTGSDEKPNPSKSSRMSLPNLMSRSYLSKDASFKKKQKRNVVANNTIFEDEIDNFEQNHCNQNDSLDCTYTVTSPPSKFYKQNSDPYDKTKTPDEKEKSKDTSAKKVVGKSFMRRARCLKQKAPQPPTTKPPDSDSNTSHAFNGSFKHWDVNSSSIYDDCVISSKGYKGMLKTEESSSDDAQRLNEELKQRRLSPPYQIVINKHGDEVEYALPYSEQEGDNKDEPAANRTMTSAKFEQIINDNFAFLHSKQMVDDSLLNRRIGNTIDNGQLSMIEPLEAFMERRSAKDIVVTDLDKSNDGPSQSREILNELESLEKWSKKIDVVDDFLRQHSQPSQKSSLIEHFQKIQNNILIFLPGQLKYKASVLRNALPNPLEFSTGSFQNTQVTLRRTVPGFFDNNLFAEAACKKDFEVLARMRHANISILMGICFDEVLNQMALVMESFDFTLNYFLHQLDRQLSLLNVISVVQQIASATSYLHECGLVHSNISSHAVLMRKHPFCVKLSCFELTTTKKVPEIVQETVLSQRKFDLSSFPKYAEIIKNDEQLKEKYYKLSKQHFYSTNSMSRDQDNTVNSIMDQKMLPYLTDFRRKFALFHYQAPELLLAGNGKLVIPTVASDTYSLALLLWECLNFCVPFVVLSELELVQTYELRNCGLPLFEKERCKKFQKVFEDGLKVDEMSRTLNIRHLIAALTEARQSCLDDGLKNDLLNNELLIENLEEVCIEKHRTNLNNQNHEKMEKLEKLEKIFFSKQKISNDFPLDAHLRNENAVTEMNLLDMAMRDISKMTAMTAESSEVEPHILNEHSFSSEEFRNQQPGILLEEPGRRNKIKQTVDQQKLIAPKKPARRKKQEKELCLDQSKRSLTDSTMYQSFFDFNRLNTPKVDKDVIYERTSTLKKRLKGHNLDGARRSAKELFEMEPPQSADDRFEKLNKELQQICDEFNRNDFMTEILKELETKDQKDEPLGPSIIKTLEAGCSVNQITPKSSVEPVRMRKKTQSEVFEHATPEIMNLRNASMLSSGGTSYRFTIGDFSLPNTPIARQNKIRRNAWLSDHKTSPRSSLVGTPPTVDRPVSHVNNKNTNDFNSAKLQIEKFDKVTKSTSSAQNSNYNISVNDKSQKNEGNEKNATGKHYNVNIRIQRNELEQNQPASKIINGDKKDSSINIRLFSPVDINATGPLIKINNNFVGLDYSTNSKIEENRTEIEDINKKYYPQMPELLSEVIQKSRDRSLMLKNNVSIADSALRAENLEARNLSFERKSKRASVRDVVKFIESTYQDTGFTYSPVKPKNTSNNLKDDVEDDDIFFTPQAMDEITPRPAKSVFDSYLATTLPKAPTNQKDQREEEPTLNESLKCLQQASESISRLTKLMVSPKVQSTHEKICKTSNEEQEMISEMNPQVFPIKNLIAASAPPPKKKITTKVTVNFKKISRRSSDVGQVQQFCKMDENGRHAICSNSELVKRFSHQLRMTADANKTSPSHDLVPKLDISANCKMPKYFCKNCGFTMLQTEMLQGVQNTGRISIASMMDSLTPNLRCSGIELRSTEDLYIDDDFCQGMGANMELLPPPDFFGSIDFDFMSAEIFHTQEQDVSDDTDELNTTLDANNQIKDVDNLEHMEENK